MKEESSLAVSIRLDAESQRHLRALEAVGFSRSDAIRESLKIAAKRLRRLEDIRREAETVAADQQDRQEMLEVATFMESLRAEG